MVKAHGRGTARRTDYVFTFSPSKRDARKPPPGGEGGKWGSHTPTRDRAVSSGIDLICYGESFYKDLRVDSASLRHLRMLAFVTTGAVGSASRGVFATPFKVSRRARAACARSYGEVKG
jgi:hypothetical protein